MVITAKWIFPVSSDPLQNHAIVVEKGRIQAIRPINQSDPPAGDYCILPGLVNAHTHLAYTGMRNVYDKLLFFPWIRKLTEIKSSRFTEEQIVLSTQLGISESLRSGITTVADMSDLQASIRVLSAAPLRGIFYWEVFGVEKEAAEETWKGLDVHYHRLEKEFSSSRLRIGISPHACYTVRPDLYKRIADWALQNQVPVSFHASESEAEEEFIRNRKGVIAEFLHKRTSDWEFLGATSIEHLSKTGIFDTKPLLAHVVQASETDFSILKDAGVCIAHCPKSNAKFGHGIAPVHTMMMEKGIRVALGTDSAASNNRLDLFEEGRFALYQQRSHYRQQVISERQILEMMTIEGARALQMEQEIGSLEIGKQADVILVRMPAYYSSADQVLNHLVYNTSADDVLKTFISGQEVRVDPPDLTDLYRTLG